MSEDLGDKTIKLIVSGIKVNINDMVNFFKRIITENEYSYMGINSKKNNRLLNLTKVKSQDTEEVANKLKRYGIDFKVMNDPINAKSIIFLRGKGREHICLALKTYLREFELMNEYKKVKNKERLNKREYLRKYMYKDKNKEHRDYLTSVSKEFPKVKRVSKFEDR